MNQAARELKLSEVVRTLPTNHRAYKEYSELVGKSRMLDELEQSLRELSRVCERGSDRYSPELNLSNELMLVKSKLSAILEASNPKPTEHRLGLE